MEEISDVEDINANVEENTDAEDATDVDAPALSDREGAAPPPYPNPRRRNAALLEAATDELRERAKASRLARFEEYAAKRRTLWADEWALLQTTKEVISIGYAAASNNKKLSDELWVSNTIWTENRAKWWGMEFQNAERCREKFLRDAAESSTRDGKKERKEMKKRWNELEKECGLLRDEIVDKKRRPGHLNVERWEKYGDEVVYGLLRDKADSRRL